MDLEILTPSETLFSGEVTLVQVPGTNGSFTILKNHAPIISTLVKGKVRLVNMQGVEKIFQISGGVVEVLANKVIVLAESVVS